MPENINVLTDENIIGHMVTLERLKANERRRVVGLLRQLEEQLIKDLVDNDPTIPVRTAFQQRRLEALLSQTQATIATAYREITREVQRDLFALAQAELGLSLNDINGAMSQILSEVAEVATAIEIASVRLSPNQLRVIASDTLIQGASTAEWWGRQSQTTQRRFADTIRSGLLRGETTQQLTREIRNMMGITQRSAEMLVRSSVQAVQTTVQDQVWEQNEALLQAVIWTSTLDLRTSAHCIVRDNKRYTVKDKKPIGHAIPWREGPGRLHPLCRSGSRPAVGNIFDEAVVATGGRPITPRAVFEKRLRELRPDWPEERIRSALQNARASMDGPVPDSLSFEEFLRKRSRADQERVLGVGKRKLWSEGKISFSDLVDFRGRPVTLEQVRAGL